MYKEHVVLPLITQIKRIIDLEILDFAVLNKKGFLFMHANVLIENSFEIYRHVEQLDQEEPYVIFSINGHKTILLYDKEDNYVCVMLLEDIKLKQLKIIYNKLMEIDFFRYHLDIQNVDDTTVKDYALLSFTFEGKLIIMNRFASEMFQIEPTHLDDFKEVFKDFEVFQEMFNKTKNDQKGQIFSLRTLRNQHLQVNCLYDAHVENIQFIFTFVPVASFYANLLDGFDHLRLGIVHFELIFEEDEAVDGRILYANSSYGQMMNLEAKDMIGTTIYERFPNYTKSLFQRYANVALKGTPAAFEDYLRRLEKHFHIYSYSPAQNECVNVYFDTTHYHKLRSSERRQLNKIQMMMKLADMGFFEIDLANKTFDCDDNVHDILGQKISGYESYRNIFKKHLHPSDKHRIYAENAQLMQGEISEGSSIFRIFKQDFSDYNYVEYYLQAIESDDAGNPTKVYGLIRDISDEKENQAKVEHMANHDQLTDLYNRHHLSKRLAKKDFKYPVKFAILDLDGLKTVNDVFGHVTGDEVISEFASLLRDIYEDAYMVRIGGDEFLVVFENPMRNVKTREKKLRTELGNILTIRLPLDVSVGYGELTDANTNYEQALHKAEEEMYRIKLIRRPLRKQKTLDVLSKYLHRKDTNIKKRIARLKPLAIELMNNHGLIRKDEQNIMKTIIDYHAIGRVMDILQNITISKEATWHERLNVETGFKILSNLVNQNAVAYGVLYLCENFDGSGQPHQLKAYDIPTYSRILAIVFQYDQLTTHSKLSSQEALKILEENAHKLYDPQLVKSFAEILDTMQ